MREHVALFYLNFTTMVQNKYQMTMRVGQLDRLPSGMAHLVLVPVGGAVPAMLPGQFVEVRVEKANVLLNRPFSIYNRTDSGLELLVSPLGRASRALSAYGVGEELIVIGPLGNGFSRPLSGKVALVGGGVGIAPLYYQARALKEAGVDFFVVYGSRTKPDGQIVARFEALSQVYVCTDDGSCGFHGLVTAHPALNSQAVTLMQVCGPKPMMMACARLARGLNVEAEVSLENMMACGLGACLCCVEPTVEGNKCVCTNGPVFNINELTWK